MSVSHKRAEQENACDTFSEAKNLITKLADGEFRSHEELKNFYLLLSEKINNALENLNTLPQEQRNETHAKWSESRERAVLQSEIMPISHLFFNLQHSSKHKVSNLPAAKWCCEIIPPKEKIDDWCKYDAFKVSPLTQGGKNATHPNQVRFCGQTSGKDQPSYDGIIKFDDNTEQRIEVTWANRNETYGKQKKDLKKTGVHSGCGNSSNDIVAYCLSAIEKKLECKYKDCWLLVVVENWWVESFDSKDEVYFLSCILKGLGDLKWEKIFTSIVVVLGGARHASMSFRLIDLI